MRHESAAIPTQQFEDFRMPIGIQLENGFADGVHFCEVKEPKRRAPGDDIALSCELDAPIAKIPTGNVVTRVAKDMYVGEEGRHEIAPALVSKETVRHI